MTSSALAKRSFRQSNDSFTSAVDKSLNRHAPSASSCEITITNPLGLHARPAAQFIRYALRFRAELWIIKDGQRYSACSLIELLRANLHQGSTVILEASGRDADEALASLCQLICEFKE